LTTAILEAGTRYLRISNREAQLALAGLIALFTGYVSQRGLPGSVAIIGIAVLFILLAAAQFKRGWTRATLVAAAINVVALLAVALEPGPLNLSVMWFSLAGFALVQQGVLPSNILLLARTALRSLLNAPLGFIREMKIIRAIRNRGRLHPRLVTLANVLLPLAAISIFGLLLMTANPLIESAVTQISWGNSLDFLLTWMPLATGIAFLLSRAVLGIRPLKNEAGPEETVIWRAQYFMPVPVIITLLALNGMFLAENILDLEYIWSGSALPAGMNYAEYVHRGSYTLIATAILAGALVIFALQPGSRSEASAPVRWLVYLWTAQNVFLVASSAKRTLSYIDAYGMTLWRLSGLIWMGLVAAGLIFIAARVITRRSNPWLINVNLGTAFAVLLTCGLIDFRAIVANWNVSRALQQISPTSTIQTLDLDTSYLRELGPSAIPALTHLIAAMPADGSIWTTSGELSRTARQLKGNLDARLRWTQMDWKTWTFRNQWIDFGGSGT
jgi:hypothetical protein